MGWDTIGLSWMGWVGLGWAWLGWTGLAWPDHGLDFLGLAWPFQPSQAKPSPVKPIPSQLSPALPTPAKLSPARPSPAQLSSAQPRPAQPSPAQHSSRSCASACRVDTSSSVVSAKHACPCAANRLVASSSACKSTIRFLSSPSTLPCPVVPEEPGAARWHC